MYLLADSNPRERQIALPYFRQLGGKLFCSNQEDILTVQYWTPSLTKQDRNKMEVDFQTTIIPISLQRRPILEFLDQTYTDAQQYLNTSAVIIIQRYSIIRLKTLVVINDIPCIKGPSISFSATKRKASKYGLQYIPTSMTTIEFQFLYIFQMESTLCLRGIICILRGIQLEIYGYILKSEIHRHNISVCPKS